MSTAKHADLDIIMLTMSRWDGPYSSASISLAKELALNHRVFFIDHPYTLKDVITKFSNKAIQSRRSALLFGKDIYRYPEGFPEKFIVVNTRCVLPVNFLDAGKWYDYFSETNDRIVFSALRKTLADFDIKNFIFFNSFDPFYMRKFPDWFQPKLFVYQTRDDISQARHSSKHGLRLENELAEKAQVVFATSSELTKAKQRINPNTFQLPNAADVDLFRKAAEAKPLKPAEIINAKGKIILYMGNIGWARVDFPLLKKIADKFPNDTLLLVGPTDSQEQVKAGLDKMPNVIFTGSKKITELPAYVAHADCALIPFQCNQLTKSIYPLKINEYLAAGKPVVTTGFSEDISEFQDVAYIARDHEQFLNLIEIAMRENSTEKEKLRIKTAEGNSWKSRVFDFWKIVNRFMQD